MGSQGAVCKHIVKVIHLQTGRSLYDIVLSLGTWAGSGKGGMDKLLDPSKPEQFSNSWADTAAAFDCEEELEQHEQRVESSSTSRDSGSNASTSAADRDNDSAVTAHFHKLLADSKGNPEMRGIIVSSLRQVEGSFREMTARGLARFAQPAPSIEKVQDGLIDSRVRMKSCLDAGYKPARKTQQAATTVSVSGRPPAVPFSKAKPSSKKRTFQQELEYKENVSAASNTAGKATGAQRLLQQPKRSRTVKCGTCITAGTPTGRRSVLLLLRRRS